MTRQSLSAVADWHAERACEAYRKGNYQSYKRHTRIQDCMRSVATTATKADLGRLSSKFKVKS